MKRDDSVSIAKGIAIILMVFGHSIYDCYVNDYLILIRMPLFFIMSGYLFKEKYTTEPYTFINKRIKGIYIPLVKYSLLFLFLHNIFFIIGIYNDIYIDSGDVSRLYAPIDFIKKGFRIITSMQSYDRLLGGYWFIHSLFWGSLIFFFIKKTLNNSIISLILLLVSSYVFNYYNIAIPYFRINWLCLYAAFFIMIGHVYKKNNFNIHLNNYFLIAGLIFIGIIAYISPTSMTNCKHFQLLPYSTAAIIGTFIILRISNHIMYKNNTLSKILIWIGGQTFAILTWHMLSFKIISIIIILIYKEPFYRLAETLTINDYLVKGWWIAYWIIGVTIPILLNYSISNLNNKVLLLNKIIKQKNSNHLI